MCHNVANSVVSVNSGVTGAPNSSEEDKLPVTFTPWTGGVNLNPKKAVKMTEVTGSTKKIKKRRNRRTFMKITECEHVG